MNRRRDKQAVRRKRGTILVLAIVTMLVVTVIALALLEASSAVFRQGRRQPRLSSMQALADGGAQYGYWKYVYGGVTLPYSETGHALGPGAFDVSVTNNSASISNTIKVVSTAAILTDTYSVTKVFSYLGAPTGLSAVAGQSSVALSWTAISGAALYNVYRSTSSGGEGSAPYASNISGTSFTDSAVSSSTTYYYQVSAVGNSEGSKSSEATATMAATGNIVAVPYVAFTTNTQAGEEDLYLTCTAPITSMTATITVKKTTGLSYGSANNTFPSGVITQANATSGANVTYTDKLAVGNTVPAGTYILASLWNLTGTAHATTTDTYKVVVTAGGVAQTLTGHF